MFGLECQTFKSQKEVRYKFESIGKCNRTDLYHHGVVCTSVMVSSDAWAVIHKWDDLLVWLLAHLTTNHP